MKLRSWIISSLIALPTIFGTGANAAYQTVTATASYVQSSSAEAMDFDQAVEYLRSQMKQ